MLHETECGAQVNFMQVQPDEIEIREEADGRFVLYLDGESILPNRFMLRSAAEDHVKHPGTLAIARQMRVSKREYGV